MKDTTDDLVLDDITFDEDNLVGACTSQVPLMIKYGRLLAKTERTVNRAEELVKTLRSQLILKVERKPELLGKASKNMQTVEAFYRAHEEYQAAADALVTAKYRHALIEQAVYAIAHRKDMINALMRVRLATVNGEPDAGLATSTVRESSNTRAAERLNRKKGE